MAYIDKDGRRIIPAPAGNTYRPKALLPSPADHPRACGEHGRGARELGPFPGSSPRLRGTPLGKGDCLRRQRIIPAPAGNTCAEQQNQQTRPDHPRACGEHVCRCMDTASCLGSSPRLRGTPGMHIGHDCHARIIPAPAGNTPGPNQHSEWPPDHPRACGEHVMRKLTSILIIGSSPRLRGTRCHDPGLGRLGRIIPAPAGNTTRYWPSLPVLSDHPRACGEHPWTTTRTCTASGSSPRLRGTRIPFQDLQLCRRIIPAPAGNTS